MNAIVFVMIVWMQWNGIAMATIGPYSTKEACEAAFRTSINTSPSILSVLGHSCVPRSKTKTD